MPRISIEEQGLGKTKRKRQKAKLVIKVRNKTWGKEGSEEKAKINATHKVMGQKDKGRAASG